MSLKTLLKATALSAVATIAIAPALVQAQSIQLPEPKRYNNYRAPRIHGNLPDLGGAWSNVTLTGLTRNARLYGERLVMTEDEVRAAETAALDLLEAGNVPTDPNQGAEDTSIRNCSGPGGRDCGYNAGWKDSTTTVMRVGGEPRTSFIIFPENGQQPPRVGAQAAGGRGGPGGAAGRGGPGGRGGAPGGRGGAQQVAAVVDDNEGGEGGPPGRPGRTDNPEGMSLGDRCMISFGNNAGPPMLPNGYYNNNIKIVQGKDSVAILVEMIHDVRNVRITKERPSATNRPFFGDSIGWYEGDTLVVETMNFEPRTRVQGANSPQTKVTERFTRVAPDRLHYRFIVEDPTVWTQPWVGEYEFQGGRGEVYEYACHEGNYGLENMLAGARFDEEQARAGRAGPGRVN